MCFSTLAEEILFIWLALLKQHKFVYMDGT